MKMSRNNTNLLVKNTDNNNLLSSLPATTEIQNETNGPGSKTIRRLLPVFTTLVKPSSPRYDGEPSDDKKLIYVPSTIADHELAAAAEVIILLRFVCTQIS